MSRTTVYSSKINENNCCAFSVIWYILTIERQVMENSIKNLVEKLTRENFFLQRTPEFKVARSLIFSLAEKNRVDIRGIVVSDDSVSFPSSWLTDQDGEKFDAVAIFGERFSNKTILPDFILESDDCLYFQDLKNTLQHFVD